MCAALLSILMGVALVRPTSAGADADPASDVLLGQGAFYPYQPPAPPALEHAMEKVLATAARQGFELKVAIIGSPMDLGAVPNFFGHPQPYAEFLDREISFNHPQPLLVVMAAGIGLVNAGSTQTLATTAIDTRRRSYGLIRTAILDAVALARVRGVRLATPAIPTEQSVRSGPSPLLVFGAPIMLLVVAGLVMGRGRRTQSGRPRVSVPRSPRARELHRRRRRAQLRRRRAALVVVLASLVFLGVELAAGGHAHSRSSTGASLASSAPGTLATGSIPAAGRPLAQGGSQESEIVGKLIALGKPIYCAGRRGKEVALTFDDGPGPYTELVLRKLRKHHVHATFFDVGRNIPLIPNAPREEQAIGALGDHTFTHPLLTALAPAEAESQIVRTQEALTRASGGSVFLFRPPYGGHNSAIDTVVRTHGMLEILWNVDSQDSLGANYAEIERNVIGGMHPGAIILMHENHGQTVRALLKIFAALERKHLRAVSVPQLLTEDPPSIASVRAGGDCLLSRGGSLSGG